MAVSAAFETSLESSSALSQTDDCRGQLFFLAFKID